MPEISAITGKPLPTLEEKFKAGKSLINRPPAIYPFENTPKEWIDRSDPNFTPSIYGENPNQIDLTGIGIINPVGNLNPKRLNELRKIIQETGETLKQNLPKEDFIKTASKHLRAQIQELIYGYELSNQKNKEQLLEEIVKTPRYQQLGMEAPTTTRDAMTPIEELATLKQGPRTKIVPNYAQGDLNAQTRLLDYFKEDLGVEGKYFLNRIEENRGSSAIHPNSKTGISMDFSTDCPKRQSACPYCYVEHGRKAKELFNMHGNDKILVETPYKREILAMPEDLINRLNSQGGMRAHSFGDYRPVQDYNQWKLALDDAEVKGLYIKAITKQPEFVHSFGDHPNLRINISIDALPREMSNAPTLEEALSLKAGRNNIKIRAVALNEKQAWEMAKNPDIDIVTLYHGMIGDKLKQIIKAQNPGLLKKVGEDAMWKEIANWQNMPSKSNTFKRLAEKYPGKICCQSGKCAGDPTKCGFGIMSAGGILAGVILPEIINEDDSDSSN